MRLRRADLVNVAVKESGSWRAKLTAMDLQNVFVSSHVCRLVTGTTTCKPLPPVVLTKLSWEELEQGVSPDRFHLGTIPARLQSLERDPWEGFATMRQTFSVRSVQHLLELS